ncbi:hypothetical protein [Alcaligenes faecalis]|uniref:hypothetical protein n=1 Tax=Alcaligenes faecalis TaxID=511 RepID=UPI001F0BA092|nr:hypothetical protein [Alcaligenes faecalis]
MRCLTASVLQPGDRATDLAGGQCGRSWLSVTASTHAEAAPAWTNGLLSFDDVSLREAARQLGQHASRDLDG